MAKEKTKVNNWFDKDLLRDIRILALQINKPYTALVEEGMELVLQQYKAKEKGE